MRAFVVLASLQANFPHSLPVSRLSLPTFPASPRSPPPERHALPARMIAATPPPRVVVSREPQIRALSSDRPAESAAAARLLVLPLTIDVPRARARISGRRPRSRRPGLRRRQRGDWCPSSIDERAMIQACPVLAGSGMSKPHKPADRQQHQSVHRLQRLRVGM